MCLVQNVESGLILTKSPTYSSWFFSQKSVNFDPTKIQNLSTSFERPHKKLLNAYFSFEIGQSKLNLQVLKCICSN